jgi:hypothetical protein
MRRTSDKTSGRMTRAAMGALTLIVVGAGSCTDGTVATYAVDGTTTVHEKSGPVSATITEQGLTRSGGCCRPTAGTVTVNRTGGPHPGMATWTFGPSCGAVMRNNVSAMLPACI